MKKKKSEFVVDEMRRGFAHDYILSAKEHDGKDIEWLSILMYDYGAFMANYHILRELFPNDEIANDYINGDFQKHNFWYAKKVDDARAAVTRNFMELRKMVI